jgi:hypothetical protein
MSISRVELPAGRDRAFQPFPDVLHGEAETQDVTSTNGAAIVNDVIGAVTLRFRVPGTTADKAVARTLGLAPEPAI